MVDWDLKEILEFLEVPEKVLNILVLALILRKELKSRERGSKQSGKQNRKR